MISIDEYVILTKVGKLILDGKVPPFRPSQLGLSLYKDRVILNSLARKGLLILRKKGKKVFVYPGEGRRPKGSWVPELEGPVGDSIDVAGGDVRLDVLWKVEPGTKDFINLREKMKGSYGDDPETYFREWEPPFYVARVTDSPGGIYEEVRGLELVPESELDEDSHSYRE